MTGGFDQIEKQSPIELTLGLIDVLLNVLLIRTVNPIRSSSPLAACSRLHPSPHK